MPLRFPRPAIAFALFLSASPLSADTKTWPVERGAARSPAAYKYDPAALNGLPPEFLDDAPACILYSGTVQRLADDGTVETTVQEVIRLNGRKGIDQFGEYRTITFNPAYEKVTLHEARVHKLTGEVEPVAPHNVHVRDVNTDHQVYDTSKQVVVSFPGLAVGDAVEIHWTTRGKSPEYQGQLFARYMLGSDKYPVARDEFTVRIPKAKGLSYASINGEVEPATAEEGGERVFKWRANGRRPPPKGDRQPPADELSLQIAVSTFTTWDQVLAWERALTADRCACTPELKRVVEDVTRGLAAPADKARALTQHVRKTVRYLSSGEKHDYTPHPPADVLRQRFGDCKDTAHLLVVLLREAGIKAGLATLGVRGDGQVLESVPSPWGTHAIAVATIDGTDHWLDTTATNLGWDVLPRDDRDRECYIIDDAGLRRARTPKAAPADSLTEQTVTVKVATDGSARCERAVTAHGIAAWTKREEYVDATAGDRRRTAANELQDGFGKVKLLALSFDALDDLEKPLTAKAKFTVADLFAGAERTAALADPTLWSLSLGVTINEERKAALDLGAPFESRCKFVVTLPPAFRFDRVPLPQSVDSPWGSFRLTVAAPKDSPRRLEFESVAILSQPRVEPHDFAAFQEFIDTVQAAYRAVVSLTDTTDINDAPALQEVLDLSPGNMPTAVALANIYLTARRGDDAARVLKAAREAAPHSRRLWELSIKAVADDDEAAEPVYRAAMKQFPDDPRFALDLADLLIDTGRHTDARALLTPLLNHPADETKCDAHLILARSALEQEEARKALRHLKDAERLAPGNFDAAAWELKGHVHEKLGDPAAAEAAFRKALDAEASPPTLEALARLTAKSSKGEALGFLRRFVESVGHDPEGLARAANVAILLGRPDDAIEWASCAREDVNRLHDLALRPLGLGHAARGEYAKAVEPLEKSPADAAVFVALLRSYLALGRLADAEARLKSVDAVDEPTNDVKQAVELVRRLTDRRDELKKLAPEAKAASLERVVCAERLAGDGKAAAAADLLEPALGDAKCGPAFGLRALIHLERGRLAKALRDAEAAIELSPRLWHGYAARGRVRLEREADGALADLEKAAELSGHRDAATLHALAAAHAKAGRTEKAIEVQREAVKLRPDDKELAEQLKELTGK